MLKESCKEFTTRLFICRYGGDEFLIAGCLEDDKTIIELKQSISESCELFFEQGKMPCPVSVSIGYASAKCRNNSEVEQLLNQADTTMYHEKERRCQ